MNDLNKLLNTKCDLNKLLNTKEDLDPELEGYLSVEGKSQLPCLKHPLVFSVPYTPELNALHNAQLKVRKEAIAEAIEKKNWWQVLLLHERPYRLNAFVNISQHLSSKEFWELLGWVWVDSENIWQNLRLWRQLLKLNTPDKEYFMDEEERKVLAELPETVTVYRGYQERRNKHGLSYTLDEKRANWFAKRFSQNGLVLIRQVKKSDIFAYKNGRGEQEVIVL